VGAADWVTPKRPRILKLLADEGEISGAIAQMSEGMRLGVRSTILRIFLRAPIESFGLAGSGASHIKPRDGAELRRRVFGQGKPVGCRGELLWVAVGVVAMLAGAGEVD
jgi:hypothetical protein